MIGPALCSAAARGRCRRSGARSGSRARRAAPRPRAGRRSPCARSGRPSAPITGGGAEPRCWRRPAGGTRTRLGTTRDPLGGLAGGEQRAAQILGGRDHVIEADQRRDAVVRGDADLGQGAAAGGARAGSARSPGGRWSAPRSGARARSQPRRRRTASGSRSCQLRRSASAASGRRSSAGRPGQRGMHDRLDRMALERAAPRSSRAATARARPAGPTA